MQSSDEVVVGEWYTSNAWKDPRFLFEDAEGNFFRNDGLVPRVYNFATVDSEGAIAVNTVEGVNLRTNGKSRVIVQGTIVTGFYHPSFGDHANVAAKIDAAKKSKRSVQIQRRQAVVIEEMGDLALLVQSDVLPVYLVGNDNLGLVRAINDHEMTLSWRTANGFKKEIATGVFDIRKANLVKGPVDLHNRLRLQDAEYQDRRILCTWNDSYSTKMPAEFKTMDDLLKSRGMYQ